MKPKHQRTQVKTYAPRGLNGRKPQFNVRLDDDVADWIVSEAERRNVSQSVVLIDLVRKAMREQEAKQS